MPPSRDTLLLLEDIREGRCNKLLTAEQQREMKARIQKKELSSAQIRDELNRWLAMGLEKHENMKYLVHSHLPSLPWNEERKKQDAEYEEALIADEHKARMRSALALRMNSFLAERESFICMNRQRYKDCLSKGSADDCRVRLRINVLGKCSDVYVSPHSTSVGDLLSLVSLKIMETMQPSLDEQDWAKNSQSDFETFQRCTDLTLSGVFFRVVASFPRRVIAQISRGSMFATDVAITLARVGLGEGGETVYIEDLSLPWFEEVPII